MIINNPVQKFGKTTKSRTGSKLKKLRSNKAVTITTYTAIFLLVVGLAYSGRDSDSLVLAEHQSQQTTSSAATETPSIDQVAAANLTADLATQVDLPVATNASNQAISINAKSELAQTNDETITKPQIIASTVSASKSFTTYKVQPGDTVPSVANKFGITSETLRWANGVAGDALEPGRDLLIPPTNGVVYATQPGDTPESIAAKFNVTVERIILYNDLEAGVPVAAGTQIIVPGGSPIVAASVAGGRGSASSPSVLAGLSGGNRYDYGYCTWYAYNRRAALGAPVGGMWGNASSWASLARASGFLVNNRPSVGSVLQTANAAGGYGHVAVVERVNPDGSIYISEMNYRGWNVLSFRDISADSVGSYNYIH